MGRSRQQLDAPRRRRSATLAKPLAPEEVRRGDFVTPLYVVSEWPSWFWCCGDDSLHPREEVVRIRSTPCDEAMPLEVIDVCLPFVLVETPQREGKTLDVRRVRLASLNRAFARRTRRALRRREKRLRKSKK